jgi:hypothetical protein
VSGNRLDDTIDDRPQTLRPEACRIMSANQTAFNQKSLAYRKITQSERSASDDAATYVLIIRCIKLRRKLGLRIVETQS